MINMKLGEITPYAIAAMLLSGCGRQISGTICEKAHLAPEKYTSTTHTLQKDGAVKRSYNHFYLDEDFRVVLCSHNEESGDIRDTIYVGRNAYKRMHIGDRFTCGKWLNARTERRHYTGHFSQAETDSAERRLRDYKQRKK